MTDLEITKLCAEAMGYKIGPHPFSAYIPVTTHHSPLTGYMPLTDDAQAMALVKKLGLRLSPWNADASWCVQTSASGIDACFSDDLNRAICECVARLQKGKLRG